MTKSYPTLRQLIHAIIVGIASHPRIQKPGIYYPVADGGFETEVLIEQYRAYGGYELENPGLCCSVYPAYSSRATKGSSPLIVTRERSIKYEDYTLGNKTEEGAISWATYSVIVELTYQDVAFGPSQNVYYDILEPVDESYPLETPHGQNIRTHTGNEPNLQDNLLSERPSPNGLQLKQGKKVEFLINPAEELLREYMDLIRLVLNDLPSIKPFLIKSSKVNSVDFPTSAWSRANTDIYFHSAYISWELTLFPPANWRQVYFMKPTVINPVINTN